MKQSSVAERTHGMSDTRQYHIWQAMKNRTTNPKAPNWNDYGGRGIRTCSRWLESFEAFWDDMGDGYADHLTLDRIDNDRGYTKENCRWVDYHAQASNRRKRYDALSVDLYALEAETGIAYGTLWRRLQRGWAVEDLTKPTAYQPSATNVYLTCVAKQTGLPLNLLQQRYRKGKRANELTKPRRQTRRTPNYSDP